MEMKDKLLNSCVLNDDVYNLLMEYVKEDNYEELKNLLEEGRVDVNHIYQSTNDFRFEDKTILQIACAFFAHETSPKCIQLLLNNDADIFYEDPLTGKNSLRFAAENGNCKILETILKFINKRQINIRNSDVILSLIKFVKDANESEELYLKVLLLLLESDIDINYENIDSGWTAIYASAKYKLKKFVHVIIDSKKHEINIDEFKDRNGKSARDLIKENNLYDGELPEFCEDNSNITIKTLYKNIRNRSVQQFKENFENIQNTLTVFDKWDLLILSVEYRLEEIVKFLLLKEVNFEKIGSKTKENPLVIACERGYHKIVKLFMFTKPTNAELISRALFALLKIPYTSEESEEINYQKCLNYLLKNEHLNINAKDFNGNSALHYALRYQNQEMVLKILRRGASLANKNIFQRLAVADIDALTLEAHLNECVRYENEEAPKSDDACIILNFTSLIPPEEVNVDYQNILIEEESQKSEDLSSEIQRLNPETEVLQYLCTSKHLKHCLIHPVILAFLYLKWHRIKMFFYINFIIYLLFILSLTVYITFSYNLVYKSQVVISISYVLLTITFILLTIREILQLAIYWHRYFWIFENWLEICLLTITGILLTEYSYETLMRQLSSVAIVLAAIELLLLVGRFPSMSTNIMMLRTVSYTFTKLLLWYSILLVAFAYSFYTLFRNIEINPDTEEKESEEQEFFEDPGMSLLKTIVMLTGEFDAGSIKFNAYPISSHIIFIIFVFLITIVLFNLLNGLAVSDTQIIKNDAELYGQILRVEHVVHVERALLNNRIIHWLPSIRNICLFPSGYKKAETLLYPNQNWKVMLLNTKITQNEYKQINCFQILFEIYLDKKIGRAIRLLLKTTEEESLRKKKEDQLLAEILEIKSLLRKLLKKKDD